MKPPPRLLFTVLLTIGCASLVMALPALSAAQDEGEESEESEEAVEEETGAEQEAEAEDETDEDEVAAKKKKKKKKGKKSEASLLVPVSEEGATVLIDGDEVGVTPIAPITGMTVGKHQVEVVKEGFHDYMGFVDIPADGTVRHDVELKGGKRKKVKLPKFMKTWWFWTAVGVVVATGVGVGVGVSLKPEEPNAVHFPPY